MKESTKILLATIETLELGRPAKIFNANDGRTRLSWNFNNLDCYVELADSARDNGILVLMRNGDFVVAEVLYGQAAIDRARQHLQQMRSDETQAMLNAAVTWVQQHISATHAQALAVAMGVQWKLHRKDGGS